MTCTEDTAIYRVCVAYANSDSRRNKHMASLSCSWRIRTHTKQCNDYRVRLVLYSDTTNMPPACFWYHTYSSIEVVARQRRQQCAWCIRWTTTTVGRCDMRKYCCPLLAAYENLTVAVVRNTNWTISTHTAVVVVLSELEQRLWLGSRVHGWVATCIHATYSFCSRT